jgi:hypothetical protein
MTVVVPNVGEDLVLQLLFNKIAAGDPVIRLFSNNITPAETDIRATYIEATFVGYGAITSVNTDWTIVQGNPTIATSIEYSFLKGPPPPTETIFGYYVTRSGAGELLWAERFTNGPYVVEKGGDEIRVVARFTGE